MLRACLNENLFRPKMTIKLISVVWNYYIVILKLLHCNSIAVFFLYFYLSTSNVTSSNVATWFQMSFSWIPMVMSLSCIISIVTISQVAFGISRLISTYGTTYSRMDQAKFVEDGFLKIWRIMVCFRLSSTNFPWPILEYFVLYVLLVLISSRQN